MVIKIFSDYFSFVVVKRLIWTCYFCWSIWAFSSFSKNR